jgi:hypothetical protein
MPIFNKDTRTEYHLITCNHPLMMDMGMSSFTLPQFIQWWYFKDGTGEYVNQKPFPMATTHGLRTLLGVKADTEKSFIIDAWRFSDYNVGIYQKYVIKEDLASPAVSAWEYYNDNPDAPVNEIDNFSLTDIPTEDVKAKTFDRITRGYEDFITEGVYAADLIALNDKYNIIGYDMDNAEDRAVRQLFKDIRRSKNSGFVSWENDVAVNVNLVDGADPCILTENFVFKLYLYNRKRPVDRTKSPAMSSIKIAAPAINAEGTNKKGAVDGESSAVADDSPNNQVGGTLKTSYRSYDGKFAAGSEQIYGIVSSEKIPAASFVDNLEDWAKNLDIEENFKSADGKFIVPGTGEIYPLDLQNGNPFQWAPNYANPSGCRGDNKEKVKLPVFNFSGREYNKSDAVIATDRYSLWFIDPLASSDITVAFPQKPVGGWQFMYFMTNEPHYLRFADAWQESNPGGKFDIYTNSNVNARHRDAEFSISRKYFKTALGQDEYKKWFDALTFKEKDNGTSWQGYAQVTSWDFMAPEFAGLRELKSDTPSPDESLGNALVLTNHGMGHDGDTADFGQIYNSYGTTARARFTAPFFGCTFPDGYVAEEKYNLYNGNPIEGDGLSGSGWRPTGYLLDDNDSFFNQAKLGVSSSGIFDPFAEHNNKSSNVSPFYFLTTEQKSGVPHCNLFSSGPNLYHLPADIATNASWEGEYGGPIMSLNKVQQYITNPAFYDKSTGQGVNWDDASLIQEQFHNFWLDSGSFQWLWNTIDPVKKSGINDPDNSILDLQPVKSNRVEFRPAPDVLFAQFDPPQPYTTPSEFVVGDRCMSYPAAFLNEQGFANWPAFGGSITSEAGGNSRYGISRWGGKEPLWGYKTKNRLLHNDAQGDKGLFIHIDDRDGYPDPALDGKVMPFNYEVYKYNNEPEWANGTAGTFHAPLSFYCKAPRVGHALYGSSPGNKSRGAFGVIGAIATTSAPDEGIEFITESYIGQPMHFIGGKFFASAGGRGKDYDNNVNSTALYVKVYESWPRDQLIYDPRFYAVHHFNAGNRLQVDNDGRRPWQNGYSFGEQITYSSGGQPDRVYTSGTQEIGMLDIKFTSEGELVTSGTPIVIDKSITNVDMRVPSFYDDINFPLLDIPPNPNVGSIKPIYDASVSESYFVFKEGARHSLSSAVNFWMPNSETIEQFKNPYNFVSESEQYDEYEEFVRSREYYTPIAKPEHWAIDPDRRARMLPWPYNKTVIAPETPKIINLTTVDPEDTLYEIVQAGKGSIIVKASGEEYEIGQQLTIQGGNGTGALLEIKATGEVGNPTEFDWVRESFTFYDESFVRVKHGEGYLPEDFAEGQASGINENTTSELRIIPASGTNRSFVGHFVVGQIYQDRVIDYKPRIATSTKGPYKLSAPDNTLEETGSTTWRDTMDIEIIPMGQGVILGDGTSTIGQPGMESTDAINATTTAQVVISLDGDGNPNVADGRYDCFFYCVNDMSHTWISSDDSPLAVENYMTMQINAY